MRKIFSLICSTAIALACGFSATAFGQGVYPDRPIRLIVGFAPGGGNDIIARLIGGKLQEAWGQSVVVENRPGANSIIATEHVANSAPDGYTLLVNAAGGMTINPSLYESLSYDSLKDFAPITIIGEIPMAFVANPKVPVDSLAEFISYAKENPGKLNYSSATSTFQLAVEMFKQMTDISIAHIPYKGSSPAISAVLSGEVQVSIDSLIALLPHIKSGGVKALGVTSAERSKAMSSLPTMAEEGVAGYQITTWVGLFAPAQTDQEIVKKIHGEIVRILGMEDVKERLASLGVEPSGSTPQATREQLQREIERYRPVIQKAGMKAN